jgi:hypothetical protein
MNMELDDPLAFSLAAGYFTLSNIMTWPLHTYLESLPALSRSIITYINKSIVHAYNLTTSIFCLGVLIRASFGPIPPSAATAFYLQLGVGFFTLMGLHLALAVVRFLIEFNFSWIQNQDHRHLGRKICLVVILVSLGIMMAIVFQRDPAYQVMGIESYLSGQPALRTPLRWIRMVIGSACFLSLSLFYVVCKCLLYRRVAFSVQPAFEGGAGHYHRHMDAKSILTGSFYPVACYVTGAVLDQIPGLQEGNALAVAILHVNSCVLLFLVTRQAVLSYCCLKIRQRFSERFPVLGDWERNDTIRRVNERDPPVIFLVIPPGKVERNIIHFNSPIFDQQDIQPRISI